MRQHTLIKMLATLNKKEIKGFHKYVQQYQNGKGNSPVLALWSYLYKCRNDWESDKLNKEKIIKRLKIDQSQLSQYATKLGNYLREFMTILELNTNGFDADYYLFQAMDKRGLQIEASHALEKMEKHKTDMGVKGLYNAYQLHIAQYKVAVKKKLKGQSLSPLLHSFTNLVAFGFASQLRQALILLNNKQIDGVDTKDELAFSLLKQHETYIQQLINSIPKVYVAQYKLIAFYLSALRLLLAFYSKQEDKDVGTDVATLVAHFKRGTVKLFLAAEESNVLFNILINMCIRLYKSTNNIDYLQHRNELYDFEISQHYVFVNGLLPGQHYLNIVRIACQEGRFTNAKTLIDTLKTYLPSEIQNDYYYLNSATLHYYKKDYEQAIHEAVVVGIVEFRIKISAYMLVLKAAYNIWRIAAFKGASGYDYDNLKNRIDSFNKYLKTGIDIKRVEKANKPDKHLPYYHFIGFYRKLLNVSKEVGYKKDNFINAQLKKIKQAIDTEEQLIDKAWLLEQVKTLENML